MKKKMISFFTVITGFIFSGGCGTDYSALYHMTEKANYMTGRANFFQNKSHKLQMQVNDLKKQQQQSMSIEKRLYLASEAASKSVQIAEQTVSFLENVTLRKELIDLITDFLIPKLKKQSEKASQAAKKAYLFLEIHSSMIFPPGLGPQVIEEALQIAEELEKITRDTNTQIWVTLFVLQKEGQIIKLYDNVTFVVNHEQKTCMYLSREPGQNEFDCIRSLGPGWAKLTPEENLFPYMGKCPSDYVRKDKEECRETGYKQGVFRHQTLP